MGFFNLFRRGETATPPRAVAPPDESGDEVEDAMQSAIRGAELRQRARDSAEQAAQQIDELFKKIQKE